VSLQAEGLADGSGWTIESAEELLCSLNGVASVRVVARPGGEIEEIHVLTTTEVTPKQTVRNVESALKAHFGMEVDHRIISVAQSTDAVAEQKPAPEQPPGPALMEPKPEPAPESAKALDSRILFVGHQIETERARRVRVSVTLEWAGTEFTGEAVGTDLARSRQEAVAKATLAAVDLALAAKNGDSQRFGVTLSLDGVKLVEAFDRTYMLVGVNAIHRREVAELAGASVFDDTPERAVIMATLQAVDRWVRGRL
jgi:hypothetical protein